MITLKNHLLVQQHDEQDEDPYMLKPDYKIDLADASQEATGADDDRIRIVYGAQQKVGAWVTRVSLRNALGESEFNHLFEAKK